MDNSSEIIQLSKLLNRWDEELTESLKRTTIQINPQTATTFEKVAAQHRKQEQELVRIAEKAVKRDSKVLADIINKTTTHQFARPLQMEDALADPFPPSTRRSLANLNRVEIDNTFFEAIDQSETIASAVGELAQMGLMSTHPTRLIEEGTNNSKTTAEDDTDFTVNQSPSATTSIYNRTVDPYSPIRNEILHINSLIAAYIFAAALDSGELSNDIPEEHKKQIRFGLTLMVGFAIGIPTGVAFGPGSGIGAGLGAAGLASQQLDDFYDIKRRQRIPEKDE